MSSRERESGPWASSHTSIAHTETTDLAWDDSTSTWDYVTIVCIIHALVPVYAKLQSCAIIHADWESRLGSSSIHAWGLLTQTNARLHNPTLIIPKSITSHRQAISLQLTAANPLTHLQMPRPIHNSSGNSRWGGWAFSCVGVFRPIIPALQKCHMSRCVFFFFFWFF